jgi:hypothetical protein
MRPTLAMGVACGDAKVAAARWDGEVTAMAPAGTPTAPSWTVGFRETSQGGRMVLTGAFPVPADWVDAVATPVLSDLRVHLPAYGDPDVQAAIVEPMFEFWRRTAESQEADISVALPLEYPRSVAAAFERAAERAGFRHAWSIPEPVAALLACVPSWRQQPAIWPGPPAGRCVWVVEAAGHDLSLTLLHVRAAQHTRPRASVDLRVTLKASERLEHPNGGETVAAVVARALSALRATLDDDDRDESQPGSLVARPWLLVAAADAWPDAPGAQLRELLGDAVQVWTDPAPQEMYARGAAVHAAIAAGTLPVTLHVTRRSRLAVRTEAREGPGLVAVTDAGADPPVQFERAFEAPLGSGADLDITLVAALPGGSREVPIATFLVRHSELTGDDRRIVIVSGQVTSWQQGEVEIQDGVSGRMLQRKEFELP